MSKANKRTPDLPRTSTSTIEDKLKEILHRFLYTFAPDGTTKPDHYETMDLIQAKEAIQAIITTETTNARKDELEKFTHWYYFERVDGEKLPIENYRDSRYAALQKEQP